MSILKVFGKVLLFPIGIVLYCISLLMELFSGIGGVIVSVLNLGIVISAVYWIIQKSYTPLVTEIILFVAVNAFYLFFAIMQLALKDLSKKCFLITK